MSSATKWRQCKTFIVPALRMISYSSKKRPRRNSKWIQSLKILSSKKKLIRFTTSQSVQSSFCQCSWETYCAARKSWQINKKDSKGCWPREPEELRRKWVLSTSLRQSEITECSSSQRLTPRLSSLSIIILRMSLIVKIHLKTIRTSHHKTQIQTNRTSKPINHKQRLPIA